MAYLIWGILGILAFIKKNNIFITLLLALFILCIFCLNTANPDLVNYIASYNGYLQYTEPGMLLLESVFRAGEISYPVFKLVLTAVSILAMASTIYRFSPYPTQVLFLYTIYPLTIDVVQYRSFVGYVIVLYAIRFIVAYQSDKKITNILLYVLFVLLATSFHYSCIVYIFLIFLFFNHKKHPFLFFIIIPSIPFLLLLFRVQLVPFVAPIVGSDKVYNWILKERTTYFFQVIRIFARNLAPLLFFLLLKYVKHDAVFKNTTILKPSLFWKDISSKTIKGISRFYDIAVNRTLFFCVYYITILSIFLELNLSVQYERISRLSLILCAVLISRQIYYVTDKNKPVAQILFLLLFVFYFISIMFFMYVDPSSGTTFFDKVFRQVMESNSLFGIVY